MRVHVFLLRGIVGQNARGMVAGKAKVCIGGCLRVGGRDCHRFCRFDVADAGKCKPWAVIVN